MAIYWIDPFLEATTQGNGTTDTTTEDGTYAAPFSITRFYLTSYSYQSGANGITFSDGDELRIKGLPFSTLFESKGNVYSYSSSYRNSYTPLRPVTGNSSFDATIATDKSSLFAFQNSDVSSFLPNWSHPAFFAAFYTSNTTTELDVTISPFIYSVVRLQLGHDSASDTGIEVFRLKDTYANPLSLGPSYWFCINKKVKVSGGWTSTTAQEGYSIIEFFNTANYQYANINNNPSTKVEYDCERVVMCYAARTSGGAQNNITCRIDQSDARLEATAHVAPMFATAVSRQHSFYCGIYTGDSTVFPWIAGNDDNSNGYIQLYNGSASVSRSVTFKNIIVSGYVFFNSNNLNCTTNIGNLYISGQDVSGVNRPFYHSISTSQHIGGTYKFLQNSVYFQASETTSLANILAPDPAYLNGGTVTYESGLKKPGIAPLDNLSPSNVYGPTSAGFLTSNPLFSGTSDFSTNNTWFSQLLSREEGDNPIEYCSLGKLTCNGNNYKTNAHNIQMQTNSAASATGAPNYMIWSAEHNDYDGKPISLISDPYTAGISYAALMYNDVVSSANVLVGQWSGTTGGASNQAWIPLVLSAPSYTAGGDNLRVTVSSAYADGASNSAAGYILLRAWHRDTTQSDNFRVYSSSATSISAGGDTTSPTTVTLNLSNVPASGQEDITSVIVGIRLDFTSNTNIQKYYITNAAIEIY